MSSPVDGVLAVDSSAVTAGPLGLLVVVLMVLATVLLIRNMNGRLRRLPRQFPEPPPAEGVPSDPPQAPDGPTGRPRA